MKQSLKATAAAVEEFNRMESMTFEFKKAWLVDAEDGKVRIRLDDVPSLELNLMPVMDLLMDKGIPERDAERYVSELHDAVTTGEMAKFLARRAKRIG